MFKTKSLNAFLFWPPKPQNPDITDNEFNQYIVLDFFFAAWGAFLALPLDDLLDSCPDMLLRLALVPGVL